MITSNPQEIINENQNSAAPAGNQEQKKAPAVNTK
jgi:hypothetical protein